MKQVKLFSYFIAALCLMFAGVSCEKESAKTPVEKPTIGILDAEFNAEKMSATVTIAPSSNATAWYYKVESADAPFPTTCRQDQLFKASCHLKEKFLCLRSGHGIQPSLQKQLSFCASIDQFNRHDTQPFCP